MVDLESLVDQLKTLLDSQWEELILRLGVDKAHLRTGVTPYQRSIDLVYLLGQQEYGLQRLQDILRDLDFFKEFIPAGTYPVGNKLRQREEAREQEAMQAAIARGDKPEEYRITPEKFYSFQRGTEWLGVFRQWDAPRSFRAELLETTVQNSQNRRNCPAAAIIGHGGSGKSVALRRLALDLVDRGYKVWWVESPERLVEFGLDDFIYYENKPQFLLIDEIQNLHSNNPICAERLQRHLKQHPSLVLVVAGRSLPTPLRLGAKDKFTPNEAADRVAILDKIAEKLPSWAFPAFQLKAESLREARLVRMLVVLARQQNPVPKNLEELEEAFLQILVDDLKRIEEGSTGLAKAIIDGALFQETGVYFSRSILIALADHHQPNSGVKNLFHEFDHKSPRWGPIISLLSYDSIEDVFQFHHDELAEGLIQASQLGLIQPYIDDPYRKLILEIVIQGVIALRKDSIGDRPTEKCVSWFLYSFNCQNPKLVAPETTLRYINLLLSSEITHHAYLRLILDGDLNLTLSQQLDLLISIARLVPTNDVFWGPVWKKLESILSEEEQKPILYQLYQAGCRSSAILCALLQRFPLEQAKLYAAKWIKNKQSSQVLCSCLSLLKEEAKSEAHRLLQEPGQDPQVLCSCLSLLKEEAKPEARRLLQELGQDKNVLCSCLSLLKEEAKSEAHRLLQEPKQDPKVLCSCLSLLKEEAKPEARRLLQEPGQDKDILCSCLSLLKEEAKPEARRLLQEPGQDSKVLCSCLSLLKEEAKSEARRLLQEPGQDKDILCSCLSLLKEEAKSEARRLLQEPRQDKDVLCSCLSLLKEEAKPEARRLLQEPRQDSKVICRCLNLLGEEAKDFAQEKISCWQNTNSNVLSQCFAIAGNTAEAEKAANEILLCWQAGKKLEAAHKVVALRAPFDTELRQEIALKVMKKWQVEYRPVVAAALTAFWNDPDAVAEPCYQILRQWKREIDYQHRNKQKYRRRNDGHIIKAMSHPGLRKQAKVVSEKMIQAEANSPGFLTPLLYQWAFDIAQGIFPSWSGEEPELLPTPKVAMLRPSKRQR